jgi:amino acid transporter
MSIGWIVVSFFTMLVAIAMAEVVSAAPTSGGPVGYPLGQSLFEAAH